MMKTQNMPNNVKCVPNHYLFAWYFSYGKLKNTHYSVCLYMQFPCRYVFIFVKHFSWEISALCPKFLKLL